MPTQMERLKPLDISLPGISLWQPWASLIFAGRKKFETRGWRYPAHMEHCPVVIHAAKTRVPFKQIANTMLSDIANDEFGCHWHLTLPYGALLGTVVLGGCTSTQGALKLPEADEVAVGDWAAGRFAWRLEEIAKFAAPIPFKGKQGWMRVPSATIRTPGASP